MSEGRRRREGLARPQARRRWRGDDARWFYGLLEGRSRHPTLCDGRGGLMMWWKRARYARWMTWRARCGWRYGGTTCRRGHASYVRVRMGGCGAPPTEDDTERGRGLLGDMQWADTCMAGRVHGPRLQPARCGAALRSAGYISWLKSLPQCGRDAELGRLRGLDVVHRCNSTAVGGTGVRLVRNKAENDSDSGQRHSSRVASRSSHQPSRDKVMASDIEI
jgi:hypothetical protein